MAHNATSGETLDVRVCNLAGVARPTLEYSEAAGSYIFSAIDVRIRWLSCDEPVSSDRVVIFRIRTHRSAARETIGAAFLSQSHNLVYADVYENAIEKLLAQNPALSKADIIACVMAHEIGHILLGPGHVPRGLMAPRWDEAELMAMSKRGIKFNRKQGEAIRRELHNNSRLDELAERLPREP